MKTVRLFCTGNIYSVIASTCFFSHIYPAFTDTSAKNKIETEISLRLASALCGLQQIYYTSKNVFTGKITRVPYGIAYVSGCERIYWTKCRFKDNSCQPTIKIIKKHCRKVVRTRIRGGVEAQQNWYETSAIDAPWDVHVRFISNFAAADLEGNFMAGEAELNDISKLKDKHRCTGTIYSQNFILTSAWCGLRGLSNKHQKGDPIVLWFARKRYRFNAWVQVIEGGPPNTKNGDIYLHPEFDNGTYPMERDHEISLIKIYGSRGGVNGADETVVQNEIPHRSDIYALEVPEEREEFTGQATFTGWGTTQREQSPRNPSADGHVLNKIELTIVPWEGPCKNLVTNYLQRLPSYRPSDDPSRRYMCARSQNPKEQGLCGGDIGGGLVCEKGGKKYMCGLKNSWGIVTNCPSPDGLEIFLKVGYYKQWIESVAAKQEATWLQPGENYYICHFNCQNESK